MGQRVPVRTVVGGGRDTHDGHENSPILVFFSNLLERPEQRGRWTARSLGLPVIGPQIARGAMAAHQLSEHVDHPPGPDASRHIHSLFRAGNDPDRRTIRVTNTAGVPAWQATVTGGNVVGNRSLRFTFAQTLTNNFCTGVD